MATYNDWQRKELGTMNKTQTIEKQKLSSTVWVKLSCLWVVVAMELCPFITWFIRLVRRVCPRDDNGCSGNEQGYPRDLSYLLQNRNFPNQRSSIQNWTPSCFLTHCHYCCYFHSVEIVAFRHQECPTLIDHHLEGGNGSVNKREWDPSWKTFILLV